MVENQSQTPPQEAQDYNFKAETRQLLNILIHSLYTDREIFLRELLSNASDALTRLNFETLTNRDIHDPEAELAIRILPDKDQGTLTIRDSGIGMTTTELIENLGTIAQSGARAFVESAQGDLDNLSEIIGQFGVGFYSAFMVAEWIRVVSRSFQPDAQPSTWFSDGSDSFRIEPSDKSSRGTKVVIKLKDDAKEFLDERHLSEIVKKHSDFVAFPIYIGDQEEQTNRQTALWRQQPRQVNVEEYQNFYKQMTLDFEAPLSYAHMVVDAPVQMYAMLYIPASPERNMFSLRKEDGLMLFSRKVLIQEYCRDLLPEYFTFIQGVVDSEDLPLNVSRESVQANRIMANLKKLVTNKVIDTLEKLAKDDHDGYNKFWGVYARYIKQGVAIEPDKPEALYPLLRFRTTHHSDAWSSLDEYTERMKTGQNEIYYILGDDERSVLYSPHLDVVRALDYEVLLLSDPVDAFMLVRLTAYKDHPLKNVSAADLELPVDPEGESEAEARQGDDAGTVSVIELFKRVLGDRVTDVRSTGRLTDSPARLVDPEGAPNQEMQRVYRLLDQEYDVPKKILEINPRHPILVRLQSASDGNELIDAVIEQLYEDALLIEGLHPEPASMIQRIQKLMEAALD
jgi:molecular chaperone HtpG